MEQLPEYDLSSVTNEEPTKEDLVELLADCYDYVLYGDSTLADIQHCSVFDQADKQELETVRWAMVAVGTKLGNLINKLNNNQTEENDHE